MDRQILAGTPDVSVVIFIFDPATGLPDTTVVFNTSGLDLRYRRDGAASVAITEVTLATLTTAHTDGGFLHIGAGKYRLDLPDAACAPGVPGVQVWGTLTNREIIGPYIELDPLVKLAPAIQAQIDSIEASFLPVGIPITVTGTPSTTSFQITGSALGGTTGDHNRQLLVLTSGAPGVINEARWITTYTAGSPGSVAFSGAADAPDGPFPNAPSGGETGLILGRR